MRKAVMKSAGRKRGSDKARERPVTISQPEPELRDDCIQRVGCTCPVCYPRIGGPPTTIKGPPRTFD